MYVTEVMEEIQVKGTWSVPPPIVDMGRLVILIRGKSTVHIIIETKNNKTYIMPRDSNPSHLLGDTILDTANPNFADRFRGVIRNVVAQYGYFSK